MNRKRDLPAELRSSPDPLEPPSPPQLAASPPPSPIASPISPSVQPSTSSASPLPPIPSPPFEQNNDDTDSLHDPFEDLPRMPDTSDEDSDDDVATAQENDPGDNNDTTGNNDPDDDDAEEIHNEPSHLYRQFSIGEERGRSVGGRGLGRAVKGDSYFMQGRYEKP